MIGPGAQGCRVVIMAVAMVVWKFSNHVYVRKNELWHWPPPTRRSWWSQWGYYGIWSIPHVGKESHAIGVCCERFGCCLLTLRGVELLHWAATLDCPRTRGGLHQVGQQDWLTQIFTHLHFLLSKKKRQKSLRASLECLLSWNLPANSSNHLQKFVGEGFLVSIPSPTPLQ